MKSRFMRFLLLGPLLVLLGQPANAIDPDLARFSMAKQKQIRDLAQAITNKVPPIIWNFFEAVRVDDWQTATNLAARINMASRRYNQAANDEEISPALGTLIWPPVSESYGAYEQFHTWNSRWLHRFGREIIESIPRGSIYFGGTDPGRFIISVLSESQVDGKPFFTLTQNQLADQAYLDYLRAMYGSKIHIPTTNDVQKAFQDYLADVDERRKHDQLKPGEDVREVNGRLVVSGAVAVMEINGMIARQLLDGNADQRFFVEESYVLDWMYPYVEPHGLIFELHHEPLSGISGPAVANDQECWKKLTQEMLGPSLDERTSLKEVCSMASKFGTGKNLEDYKGDKTFAANKASRECFAKLRCSIAGIYAWRMDHSRDAAERERMYQAADLAMRQSYAICPQLPEGIFRFIGLLQSRKRTEDAILIAKTSLHLDPENQQLQGLVAQLMKP